MPMDEAESVQTEIKIEPQEIEFEDSVKLECLVCEEKEAGRHYGSVCCSGCKGFFRRTVRFNKVFSCPYKKQCAIRREYRNCCRACRYQKCLQAGLNPNLVHGDRGSTKISQHSSSHQEWLPDHLNEPCSSSKTCLVFRSSNKNSFTDVGCIKSEIFELDSASLESIIIASRFLKRNEKLPLGTLRIIPAYDPSDFASIAKYFILVERLCNTYVDSDLSHLSKDFKGKCSVDVSMSLAIREPRRMEWEPRFYITSSLLKQSWCRIIVQYFDWASHLPELEELDERDQELLILGRAVASTWIMFGRKSVVTNSSGITVTGGAYLPCDRVIRGNLDKDSIVNLMSAIIDVMVHEFINPMRELQVTEAEFAILIVICFLMPVPKLSASAISKINAAKAKYIDAFTRVVQTTSPDLSMPRILNRISRIMLLVSVVEKVAEMVDNTFALMALFNISEMQGTLSYDVHVRKNDPFATLFSSHAKTNRAL